MKLEGEKLMMTGRIELLDSGRVYDRHGPHQTLLGDRPTGGKSEKDSKSYKKICWNGLDAEYPQAP